MTRTTRMLVIGGALTTTLVVGACSASSTGTQPGAAPMTTPMTMGTPSGSAGGMSSAAHNQADTMFASGMVPHHEQAIEMADLALSNSTNADIKALATQIKQAQAPEIEMMNGWLGSWGATAMPSGDMTGMPGLGGMGESGGMSDADMTALEQATGTQFDRLFLQSMIKHHTSAITMAQAELSQGQLPEGKQLAQSIIDSQTKEVATMTQMLQKMGG